MKKLLTLLVLLLASYISFSQGLNDDYTTVFNKVKNGKFTDITFNTNDGRKWINAYSQIGWNSYGFPIDGNICEVVILAPYSKEGVIEMIKYCNTNLVTIDTHNWNFYRDDGSLGRVTLVPIGPSDKTNRALVFYFYNL